MSIKTIVKISALAALALLALPGCDTSDNSDYYGPKVRFTNPSFGASGIPTNTTIAVLFNEVLRSSSVTPGSMVVRTIVDGNILNVRGSVSSTGNSALFVPEAALTPYSTYVVTLALITDRYGNPMDSTYSWYFTTGEAVNPIETFSMANTVLGQDGFDLGLMNKGGVANAASMAFPGGIYAFANALYVADSFNHRVLGFGNIAALANGAAADFVLGQADFTSTVMGAGAGMMNQPMSVFVSNSITLVADTWNNRVLVWNSAPMVNGTTADYVLGQPGFDNSASGCSAYLMNFPTAAIAVGDLIYVADAGNNRVLIWNSVPGMSNAPADAVLGQQDLDTCAAGAAMSNSLTAPTGLATDGARLVVADKGNNRLLVWNPLPMSNTVDANVVIGQMDMTSNDNYVSASDMGASYGIYVHGGRLLVSDSGNNRVLVWDRIPTRNYTAADAVLGQGDFHHYAPNDADQDGAEDASPSAETLNYPSGVFGIGNRVFVSDSVNNRVLIYNTP